MKAAILIIAAMLLAACTAETIELSTRFDITLDGTANGAMK